MQAPRTHSIKQSLAKAYTDGEYEDLHWRFAGLSWPNPPARISAAQPPTKYLAASGRNTISRKLGPGEVLLVCVDPDSASPIGTAATGDLNTPFELLAGLDLTGGDPWNTGTPLAAKNGSWAGNVDPRFILTDEEHYLLPADFTGRVAQYQSKRCEVNASVSTDAYAIGRVLAIRDQPLLFGPSRPSRYEHAAELIADNGFNAGTPLPQTSTSTPFRDLTALGPITMQDLPDYFTVGGFGANSSMHSKAILGPGPSGVRSSWNTTQNLTEDEWRIASANIKSWGVGVTSCVQTYAGRMMYVIYNDSNQGNLYFTLTADVDYNVFAAPSTPLASIAMSEAASTGNAVAQREPNMSHSVVSPFVATRHAAHVQAVKEVASTTVHAAAQQLAAHKTESDENNTVGSSLGAVLGGAGAAAALGPEAAQAGAAIGGALGNVAETIVKKIF